MNGKMDNGQIFRGHDVAKMIHFLRGGPAMLSQDLAALYQVPTKQLNRAVFRNADRFPPDFMFELTTAEALRCQIGTSKRGRGGIRYTSLAFTEMGIAMLSSVLNSDRAIQVNIQIMRTFVRLGRALAADPGMKNRLKVVEATVAKHDAQILTSLQMIKELRSERRPRTVRFIRGDDPKEGDPN